jgi:hypothetical protein
MLHRKYIRIIILVDYKLTVKFCEIAAVDVAMITTSQKKKRGVYIN